MRRFLILALLLFGFAAPAAAQIRIKDLVEFDGVRGNDLVGYGLVVGLNGTGDGIRNAPFTEEIMSNILERLGVNVTGEQFRPKNVAAVFVTTTLPPFARAGGRLDVSVSAIGDAKSLLGGTLIMTPLNAADGNGAQVVQGVPTAGIIPTGARVEREIEFDFTQLKSIRLALRTPDFTTAGRIEDAINGAYGGVVSRMLDAGTVLVDIDATGAISPAHALGQIENIEVTPELKARIVVDQSSGTIVIGRDVKISNVAVAQGNLTLRVQEEPIVVQPNPFSDGETVVVARTTAGIEEEPGIGLAEIPDSTTLSEVVAGLNALGVNPRDMIDILKTIKAAGALHAEFVVQ